MLAYCGMVALLLLAPLGIASEAAAAAEETKAILLVAEVVEVNESRAGGGTGGSYSASGPPNQGFRTLISEQSTGESPDNASVLRLRSLAEIMRQQDTASVIANKTDDNSAPVYDPVGPVVVVLQNVTPPTSRTGTPYESLTITFGFDGFVTIGEVRDQNLLVIWCQPTVCEGVLPRLRALLAEEGRYFLPRIATTTLDERRMDALGADMPAVIDAEKASILFRTASAAETNATRYLPPERLGVARTQIPFAITAAFDAAHEKQDRDLSLRKTQLAARAASYKDQVGRAQTAQAIEDAAEENQANFRLLVWTLILALASVVLSSGIMICQTVVQHKDAKAALDLARGGPTLLPKEGVPPPSPEP